jgi:tetratricopeptide (TPR) repeat protein
VRERAALASLAAVAWVLATLASGCRSHDTSSSAAAADAPVSRLPDARALRPVSLPDFSRMAESERDQIRERYVSLMRQIDDPATTTIELGNAYGEMGKLFMAAQYLDAAESCYLNAQALVPGDMRWPYYLGHVYRTKGALAESAAFFGRALELRPDDVTTLIWRGNVYITQGQPEAAEPLLAKALSLQPGSVAARFGLGRAALARQDYVQAVKHLEEALAVDPQAAGIHYPLAMAYRGLGEQAKAEAHLRQRRDVAIAPVDPLMQELEELVQSPAAYERRGTRALDSEQWAAAAAYFRKGIELAPADPSLRHKLGTALYMTGDAHGALEQFEHALRVSPEFAKAHYSLGVLMEASGRGKEAIERFSAAVRYEPTYVEARFQLAEALRRSGRFEESLSHYQQIFETDPRVGKARLGYAMALVALKRYQEARDRLTEFPHALVRLLAAAPDDRVRDGRRAMAIMQGLLAKERRTVEIGEMMAMTLAELGQYIEAVAWQRESMAAAERTGRHDLVERLAENLRLYERREPCRTPWRDDTLL